MPDTFKTEIRWLKQAALALLIAIVLITALIVVMGAVSDRRSCQRSDEIRAFVRSNFPEARTDLRVRDLDCGRLPAET